MSLFRPADRALLLDLLALPTAGPLEHAPDAPALWQAQRRYAEAAADLGFTVVHHAAPPPACVERDDVPLLVRQAAAQGPEFLACQPSLVLALGPATAPVGRTVMFNVHLDTVAGRAPVSFDGERFHGRGAIDAKGPAVALLAGLRRALQERPALAGDTRILVQAVSGEEGGALGTFGTRPLVEAGHYGRLNVFCEPTGGRALVRCTAAMTARLSVHGRDAIDDRPGAGHNATVLLGHLAHTLATALDPRLDPADGQVCVAGLHTGTLHNRVYGSGQLLLNLSYGSPATRRRLERLLHEAVDEGLRSFATTFRHSPRFARTAADATDIVCLDWLKRGLPALEGDPSWWRPLLDRAGVPLWPAHEPGFTCDAIWMAGVPGAHCTVLGPGSLEANRAHAEGEFADLAELDAFAAAIPRLLAAFCAGQDSGTVPAPAQPPEPSAPPAPPQPDTRSDPPQPRAQRDPFTLPQSQSQPRTPSTPFARSSTHAVVEPAPVDHPAVAGPGRRTGHRDAPRP